MEDRPGPSLKRPPERSEWENRRFAAAIEEREPDKARRLKFKALSAA